jgi:AraC-like DNA-binding protein
MGLLLRLIYRNRKINLKSKDSLNRAIYSFIITLTALHLPLIIPGIFGAMFHLKWFSIFYMNQSLALVLIATTVFILFSPKILYGFLPQPDISGLNTVDENLDSVSVLIKPKPAQEEVKLRISEAELQVMIKHIEDFMEKNKPFIDTQYTIHDLSRDINIPVYQLSPIINNYYQSNFNSWLNKFRVDYFIRISQDEGKNGLTLDAIAKEAGFTNRTTFTNAFKKEKGTTPGQFIKALQFGH